MVRLSELRGHKEWGKLAGSAVTPELGRLRQENHKYKANFYIVNSRPAWATEGDTVSKEKKKSKLGLWTSLGT
jgi:hypothetical protein